MLKEFKLPSHEEFLQMAQDMANGKPVKFDGMEINISFHTVSNALPEALIGSLDRIRDYLSNANDTTLKFLGVSQKQRDALATAEVNIAHTMDNTPLGVAFTCKENHLHLLTNGEIPYEVDTMLDKAMSHEVCHWLQRHKDTTGASKVAGDYGQIINHYAKKIFPVLSAVSVFPFAWQLAPAAYFAAPLFYRMSTPLFYLPSRLEEKKCDLFSDKMVPEVTYDELAEQLHAVCGEKELEAYSINKYNYKEMVSSLFKTHPSDYTRTLESEKNCAKFLEYKKQHNIPSLHS